MYLTDETMAEMAAAYDEEARMLQADIDALEEHREAEEEARTRCEHDAPTIEHDSDGTAFYACTRCGATAEVI